MVEGVSDQFESKAGEPEAAPSRPSPHTSPGFDNRQFWEERYTTKLDLGSGAGSRGEFLEYKKELLTRLIDEFDIQSILDVGCGDIEVVKDLAFSGEYTGIDLSPSIVARNQELRPSWTFIEGDFLELARRVQLQADLVIGFDVLIHQHDYETYRTFVRELANATRVVAVINGFDALPRSGRVSANCAYHEPITQTVREVAGGELAVTTPFRNTTIVQLEKRPGEDPQ